MRISWLIASFTFIFTVCGVVYGESVPIKNTEAEISVLAEGSGAIYGGDLAKAKDDAIADAKKNAVEQGVGVFISSKTLGKDYFVVEKTILARADGYISSWSVVENSQKIEKFEGDKILTLKIRANVRMLELISDLSDVEEVYNSINRPKVMVLINESNMGKKPDTLPASAISVMAALQDQGFDVVDPEIIQQLVKEQSVRRAIETGDTKSAAVLAMKKGAQILVLGNASASPVDISEYAGADVHSASALLGARIVYADTGEVLYITPKSVQGKALSLSNASEAGTKALEDAGSKLISADSNRFSEQVLARWAKESYQGRVFRIVVHNVKDSEFEATKSAISKFRGFAGFVGDSNYEGKTGQIDLRYTLTLDSFRSDLRKVKVGKKSVEITRTSGTVTEFILELP